jgi:hypothetical protein
MLRYPLFIACIFLIVNLTSCVKEYSYEGGPPPPGIVIIDSIPQNDTIPQSEVHFPGCSECKETDELLPGAWNFKVDTSFVCGKITAAIKSPDGNGFTFFGPSKCTLDTGIVLTIFLDGISLDQDLQNVTIKDVIFEYYDNEYRRDIFGWLRKDVFMLTISTYTASTKTMIGTFSGYVKGWDNLQGEIKEGNFYIQFQ